MSYASLGYSSTAQYFGLGDAAAVPDTGTTMSDILPGLIFVGLAAVGIGYLLTSRPSMRANKRRGRGRRRGRKHGRKRSHGRRGYRHKKRGRGKRKHRRSRGRRRFKYGVAGMKKRALYGGRRGKRRGKKAWKKSRKYKARHVFGYKFGGHGGGGPMNYHDGMAAGWASPKQAGGRGWLADGLRV